MKVLGRFVYGLTLCVSLLPVQLTLAEPPVVSIVPTIADNSILPDAIQTQAPGPDTPKNSRSA